MTFVADQAQELAGAVGELLGDSEPLDAADGPQLPLIGADAAQIGEVTAAMDAHGVGAGALGDVEQSVAASQAAIGQADAAVGEVIAAAQNAHGQAYQQLSALQQGISSSVPDFEGSLDTAGGQAELVEFLLGKADDAQRVVAAAAAQSVSGANAINAAGAGYGEPQT